MTNEKPVPPVLPEEPVAQPDSDLAHTLADGDGEKHAYSYDLPDVGTRGSLWALRRWFICLSP